MRYTSIVTWLAIAVAAAACGGEQAPQPQLRQSTGQSPTGPSAARDEIVKHGAGLVVEADKAKAAKKLLGPRIAETDFIESPRRRDPFRPFVEVLIPEKDLRQTVQREVKLEEWDIEQLRLVALITNIGDPRAMVVPPDGVGHILHLGDYVGKPDFVDTGSGGERIQINWKVYRIHNKGPKEERGIYLVRDDPLTPTPNDITRFLPLYPQE